MRLRACAGVLIGVVASVLLWGHWYLLGFAVLATAGALWSLGTISNYALGAEAHWRSNLRRDMLAEGHSEEDIAERLKRVPARTNPDHIPDWLVLLNLFFSIACVALLVVAAVLRLKA